MSARQHSIQDLDQVAPRTVEQELAYLDARKRKLERLIALRREVTELEKEVWTQQGNKDALQIITA